MSHTTPLDTPVFLRRWIPATALSLMVGFAISCLLYWLWPLRTAKVTDVKICGDMMIPYDCGLAQDYALYLFEQPIRGILHFLPFAVTQYLLLRRWLPVNRTWILATVAGFVIYLSITAYGKYNWSRFPEDNYSPNFIEAYRFYECDSWNCLAFYNASQVSEREFYPIWKLYIPLVGDEALPAALCGLCVGLCQYLCVARRWPRAWLFVAINGIGFMLSFSAAIDLRASLTPWVGGLMFNPDFPFYWSSDFQFIAGGVVAIFCQLVAGLMLGTLTGIAWVLLRYYNGAPKKKIDASLLPVPVGIE